MIDLNFSISNPWYKYQQHRSYFYNAWRLFKNKAFEVQVENGIDELLGFSFNWTIRNNHAGVRIRLYFLHRFIFVTFYDIRHWNHEESKYLDYSPEELKKLEKNWRSEYR